jgi:hypothetical protein
VRERKAYCSTGASFVGGWCSGDFHLDQPTRNFSTVTFRIPSRRNQASAAPVNGDTPSSTMTSLRSFHQITPTINHPRSTLLYQPTSHTRARCHQMYPVASPYSPPSSHPSMVAVPRWTTTKMPYRSKATRAYEARWPLTLRLGARIKLVALRKSSTEYQYEIFPAVSGNRL